MNSEIKNNMIYSSTVIVNGGREGTVKSDNPSFDIKLSLPQELGGIGGDGTNPEQLFAAAYGACLLEAIKSAAVTKNLELDASLSVESKVSISSNDNTFYLQVELKVNIPHLEKSLIKELVDRAQQIWPYAKAKLADIKIDITLVN